MSWLTSFLANNYLWFLIGGIILIFALIGYIVDAKNVGPKKLKTMKLDDLEDTGINEPSNVETLETNPTLEKAKDVTQGTKTEPEVEILQK